jgi:hypothetical protein
MKNLTLLILVLFVFQHINAQSDFSKGWDEGYREGYCYNKYGCVSPVPPVSSVPAPGQDNYKGGYNAGFIKGQNDKKTNESNSSNIQTSPYSKLTPLNNGTTQALQYWSGVALRNEQIANTERQRSRPEFRMAFEIAKEAFEKKDYWTCIREYNNSSKMDWYDIDFYIITAISCVEIWEQYHYEDYYEKATKLFKKAKRHGHPQARKLLEELEIRKKKTNDK